MRTKVFFIHFSTYLPTQQISCFLYFTIIIHKLLVDGVVPTARGIVPVDDRTSGTYLYMYKYYFKIPHPLKSPLTSQYY